MWDQKYEKEKKDRQKTDPNTVAPAEDKDLQHVFSKKNLDALLSNEKYDHKIKLEEKHKNCHILDYKMSV